MIKAGEEDELGVKVSVDDLMNLVQGRESGNVLYVRCLRDAAGIGLCKPWFEMIAAEATETRSRKALSEHTGQSLMAL